MNTKEKNEQKEEKWIKRGKMNKKREKLIKKNRKNA